MPNIGGKYVSGHLKNKLKPAAPEKGAQGKETMQAHKPGDGAHLAKPVNVPTQPHSMTGVHKVEIHHHGGGHYSTHTHHSADGGDVESQDHNSAMEAHAKAQEDMPDDNPTEEALEAENTGGTDGMDVESLGQAV